MSAVVVRIVQVPAPADAGPLGCLLAAARAELARVHRRRFLAAHAATVEIIADPRALARSEPGSLVLDAASLPFATASDAAALVASAADDTSGRGAPDADLAADDVWRRGVRIDSPLDLVLAACDQRLPSAVANLGRGLLAEPASARLRAALADMARVLVDRRSQVLLIASRPSAPAWPSDTVRALTLWEDDPRRSFDMDRPDFLASALAPQADAAILDTRLILAKRLLRRRRTWPPLEDRFASDLLRPDAIGDPWLRDLTGAATASGLPILLGGPSLVGWGIRLLLTGRRRDPIEAEA